MHLPSPADPPASVPLPLVRLAGKRNAITKEMVDNSLAVEIRKDLPAFYERFRQIALEADDQHAINALKYLVDRVAGAPHAAHDPSNGSLQAPAVQVNIAFVESLRDHVRSQLLTVPQEARPIGADHP